MRKEKNTGRWQMMIGACLLICAFVIIANNTAESKQAAKASQVMLSSIRLASRPEPESTAPLPAVSEPAYRLNPGMEMPTEIIDGQACIGILEVPVLDLALPVINDWSYPALKKAPCRYKGSAYSGDLIICAHNYDQHFGRLKELKHGDTIRLTDMDGNVFTYEAVQFEQLRKNQTADMLRGEWDLTLFTCVTGGQKRVTIRCILVDEQPA